MTRAMKARGLLLAGGLLLSLNQAPADTPAFAGLDYPLPAVGSYRLPPIDAAADGQVLDADGRLRSLHDIYAGRITLLGFIYSRCSDADGCPLTASVFYKLKTLMNSDPELAERLQLASLSFDPEHDTPQVMKLYGANFKYAGNAGEWRFFTTASQTNLQPILRAYNQDVQQERDAAGETSGVFSHILRVFLIDRERRIRNIYSTAFLHPDLLLNDVRTLMLEENSDETSPASAIPVGFGASLSVPGDDKRGYESADYRTHARAVAARRGRPADLLALALRPPLGLPPLPVPENNPLTEAKIALGRKLFYDRRLSLNDTFSCAMCHVPEQGFTSNELAMAVGIEGRTVRRNSPTLYNVAYAPRLFPDGREENLEQQVWGPLLADNEMGNPSVGAVLGKIRALPDYDGLFESAFRGRGPDMETLGMALASYQRTLLSADSPFDRWYFGQQQQAMDDAAKRGYALFTGKANCVGCHRIEADSALFSDHELHNTGIGYQRSMGVRAQKTRISVAPGVFIDVDRSVIDAVGEAAPADVGLYEITQDPDDRWKYRTPSLRNLTLTAPYMHDGSLSTLREVVEFYNQGGVANDLQDPRVRPLGLSQQEIDDLLAFLRALTGSNVDLLVADAFAAPVGDPVAVGPGRSN